MEQGIRDSIEQFQEILTVLYTDKTFRDQFFENRQAVLSAYILNPREEALLLELNQVEVNMFADTLLAKRYGNLLKIFPDITTLIEPARLEKLFKAYASTKPLGTSQKYLNDTIGFFQYLINTQSKDCPLDVLRDAKEKLKLIAFPRMITIKKFNYDWEDLWDYDKLQTKPHLHIILSTLINKKVFL